MESFSGRQEAREKMKTESRTEKEVYKCKNRKWSREDDDHQLGDNWRRTRIRNRDRRSGNLEETREGKRGLGWRQGKKRRWTNWNGKLQRRTPRREEETG